MSKLDNHVPFHRLAPDQILDSVDSAGFNCDGHITPLNSYENRVYQIGIEQNKPVIAKFYRPQRWTDACILEEHSFTLQLQQYEIPVIAPLINTAGKTLHQHGPYRFAIYPRVGGRAPELDDSDHLKQLGRCLARIHSIGAANSFAHRPRIDIKTYAIQPRDFLLKNAFIPEDLVAAYESLSEHVIISMERCLNNIPDINFFSIHGDCHLGNILWFDDGPFIVDFDDACTGPAIQDLWMFLSGDRTYMTARLQDLLTGYCEFKDFDAKELHLIEMLRTLRIMYFAGWIARRWNDPAFPMAFPTFNTQQYWEDHILTLKEQLALMDEPPLQWQQ